MNDETLNALSQARSLLNVLIHTLPKGKDDVVHLPAGDLIGTLQMIVDNLDKATIE